jgi:thiamine kinase-like enzyme
MNPSLETILARVPGWQDRTDIHTTFLSGGITNRNYRVDVGPESFVLRVAGARTELLGIDRRHEYAAHLGAAAIGVAPEVVYFVEPEGYLITRFIPARAIPPEEMRGPDTLRAVARTLNRVHSMAPIPGTFSPFQVVRAYDRLARAHGVTTFPENYAYLRARMDEIESALVRAASAPVPCHNDLLNGNFLSDATGIRILDWEYAGMGDRLFDLANFSAHHELDEAQDRLLLDAYLSQHDSRLQARLELLKAMSDFREAMWGILQQGISQLDFDFRAYADQFFLKLTQRTADSRYHDRLAAV